jgi:hypothetical protein
VLLTARAAADGRDGFYRRVTERLTHDPLADQSGGAKKKNVHAGR